MAAGGCLKENESAIYLATLSRSVKRLLDALFQHKLTSLAWLSLLRVCPLHELA